LRSEGFFENRLIQESAPATRALIEQVHAPAVLDAINDLASIGGAWLDGDTYITSASYDVALHAAGAAVGAVDVVLEGLTRTAFALVRPPGHHATVNRSMGFCLINNIAVAAAHALESGVRNVAIVDWDVHHGNGTQDIFYSRSEVHVSSVHQYPFYPGTGSAAETGTGPGAGYTLNVPIQAGAGDQEYAEIFKGAIIPAIEQFEPELILISAGFDAHADDPLGGMRVTERGFANLASQVAAVAESSANGRVVAVLEGGYDPSALGRSVAATIAALDKGLAAGV
jgi:acetoin utilization deacetylase AcuC-like enzyme